MTAINSQSRVLSFRLRTPYLKRSCHSEIVRGPIGPVKLTRGRIHVAASTPLREEPSLQPQEVCYLCIYIRDIYDLNWQGFRALIKY